MANYNQMLACFWVLVPKDHIWYKWRLCMGIYILIRHNYQYSKTFVPPATLIYALVLLPAKSEPFALIEQQEMRVTHRANQKQWHDICLIVKAAHCDKSMPVTKCSSNKSWNYIDQLSQFQFKRSLQFHKATAGCEEHNNANLIIDS